MCDISLLCANLAMESEEPLTLFFDFDRSLCSTKAGGSPTKGNHSVDPDLAALANQHPMYVITRNSHANDIETFLRERGVACCGVRVVPKGTSKAHIIADILPGLEARSTPPRQKPRKSPSAVFVDDTVRECCDPSAATLPGLYRFLFRRGFVGA